jgi:fido (protein-threonine AMPylation protein)
LVNLRVFHILALFTGACAALAFPVRAAKAELKPSSLCMSMFRHLGDSVELTQDANFTQIREAYQQLLKQRKRLGHPGIDARRLINPEDWKTAKDTPKPWTFYGRGTMSAWLDGMRFIQADANGAPLTIELLQKVHTIATRGLPFHGFEGRRIRARLDAGEISKEEFRSLLDRAYRQNEAVSGVPHDQLRGVLRREKIDQIWHSGSSRDPAIGRFFTADELARMRKNLYMDVDEANLKEVQPGKWEGRVYYFDVENVERAINIILRRTNFALANEPDQTKKLAQIIQMETDLLSIHPFLDGNGRSVRLVGDLLRKRIGFPPPLYPNENDLTMTRAEALEFHRKAMIDYVNSFAARLRKVVREEENL